MTVSRAAIITEALSWEGVPYVHGQQSRYGCDCIGYGVAVAQGVGALDASYTPPIYSNQWHLHNTKELLKEGLLAQGWTPTASPEPGDLLLFRFGLTASHTAILLPDQFIVHAVLGKRVIRQRYTPAWQKIYDSAYQFPGVC